MSEVTLHIHGSSDSKIRVDPTEVRAEGGALYPRLIIPAKLNLSPLNYGQIQEQSFVVLCAQSSLFLKGNSKLADSLTNFNHPYTVSRPNTNVIYSQEFPLDVYRVRAIEENRTGNITLNLNFNCLVILNEQKILKDFTNSFAQLEFEIPQSHWVEKILPSLGFGDYFIVEIPKGQKSIQDAWNYLEEAEKSFDTWNIKGVFASCREVGSLLDRTLKQKFGETTFTYKERWTRAHSHLASLFLHIEDIKKSDKYSLDEVRMSKADAEHLIIVTKALIKYAEELIRE